jgi:hypothetical protein
VLQLLNNRCPIQFSTINLLDTFLTFGSSREPFIIGTKSGNKLGSSVLAPTNEAQAIRNYGAMTHYKKKHGRSHKSAGTSKKWKGPRNNNDNLQVPYDSSTNVSGK